MSYRDTAADSEIKEETRLLDGILPEEIDRRKFLTGAATSVFAGLAGCTGGSGGNKQNGNGGQKKFVRDVIWRQPWKLEPNYSIAFASELEGFWADRGISPPRVEKGYGSGDTTRRVATGKETFGNSNVAPQVSSLGESGVTFHVFGCSKQRINRALLYNSKKVSDPTDIEGKKFATTSALGQQTLPLYAEATGNDPSKVKITMGKQSAAVSLVGQGKVDGIWSSVDDLGPNNERLENVTLKAEPLYNHLKIIGYATIVNAKWLKKENNTEFTTRILSGYSHAGKWALLNPEKVIQMMIDHVNPALQTWSKKARRSNFRSGVASSNTVPALKEKGFAWLEPEKYKRTLKSMGKAMGTDVPTADDVMATDVIENAKYAKFSADEFKQLNEFVGNADRFFEK